MFTHLHVIMHKIKYLLVYKYAYIPQIHQKYFFS